MYHFCVPFLLFGTFIYFLGFGAVIFKIVNFKKYNTYFMVFISLFTVFFGISLTSGNLYQSVETWCVIALLLSWPKENLEIKTNTL